MSCLTSKETRKGLGNRVEGIHIYTHVQACFKMITLKHACTYVYIYTCASVCMYLWGAASDLSLLVSSRVAWGIATPHRYAILCGLRILCRGRREAVVVVVACEEEAARGGATSHHNLPWLPENDRTARRMPGHHAVSTRKRPWRRCVPNSDPTLQEDTRPQAEEAIPQDLLLNDAHS